MIFKNCFRCLLILLLAICSVNPFAQSDSNYVTIHLKSEKKIMVRSTLNDFEEQLDLKIFNRIHRSYSVNTNMIEDVFPIEVSVGVIKIPIGKS